jgi:predicted GH43/DUF377 family glycosyl hydrolase
VGKWVCGAAFILGFSFALCAEYPDGRPSATLRCDATDAGVVYRHGSGPADCDKLGARDVWVFEAGGKYFMHYDAAGPKGWLAALAVSDDGVHWNPRGPVLDLGTSGSADSASASYGTVYHDKETSRWHMFYLGTPHVTPPPDLIPGFPYLTLKATAAGPEGPWIKQYDVTPFRPKKNSYYEDTASPGQIIKQGSEYLQFFSSSAKKNGRMVRTLSIARTADLNAEWKVQPEPIVPLDEQIENSSLYYEPANKTWFLFTNHIGLDGKDSPEYTDAIWMYWTQDLTRWDVRHKAVVLDGKNCGWSKKCIGLPSVLPMGGRLAIYYDAPGGNSTSHMGRDVGLAWLDLPLEVPQANAGRGK